MNIYIASSFRNITAVQLLSAKLAEHGHKVFDWSRLAPPVSPHLNLEARRAAFDSDERGEIFAFCSHACGSVDLCIYLGPAGQDAGVEVGMAWVSGTPVWGLAGPLEKPGLMLNGAVARWFDSVDDLLFAIHNFTPEV